MKWGALLACCLALASFADSDLLGPSQQLWSRVLDGGFSRLGRLDPLRVPVIEVEQSEAGTSYRALLRDLQLDGLNDSRIESVRIARGRLDSELGDDEAGYVRHDEARAADSIRYRLRTLVKQPRSHAEDRHPGASGHSRRLALHGPARAEPGSAQNEPRRGCCSGLAPPPAVGGGPPAARSADTLFQLYQRPRHADTRLAMHSTPESPCQVRLVYAHSRQSSQAELPRACVGACRPDYASSVASGARSQPSQPRRDPHSAHLGRGSRPAERFSIEAGDSAPSYSAAHESGAFSVEARRRDEYASAAQPQAQSRASAKGGAESGASRSADREGAPLSARSQSGGGYATTGYPQKQYSGYRESGYTGGYKTGPGADEYAPFPVNARSEGPRDRCSLEGGEQGAKSTGHHSSGTGSEAYGQTPEALSVDAAYHYERPNGQRYGSASDDYEVRARAGGAEPSADNSRVSARSENSGVNFSGGFKLGPSSLSAGKQRDQQKYRANQQTRDSQATSPLPSGEFEPRQSPVMRLEKQPGYVDIVYAPSGVRRRSGQYSEPRHLGDAARVAGDSGRIGDLPRYAKEYREERGYYEEGMQLVYHFGDLANDGSNASLARTKRQPQNDTDEDDLMHVVVRLRIPQLGLKSSYALEGKVGQRPLKGAGLLSANFTDVVADFSLELKRVDNRTMIVRAARAKLASDERKLGLQGMDENGPVASVLSHGLMAAEAVAAMIADDLLTKVLNENNNAEAMVYKMYQNLPVLEKS